MCAGRTSTKIPWNSLPTMEAKARPPPPGRRTPTRSPTLSDGGELWVATSTTDTRTIYDRFDRGGKHVETVSSPLHVAQGLSPVVRGDRFWAVVSDSLGVNYVVRARITPVPAGEEDE